MKVSELIQMLEDCDPESEVRLAMQPSWPFVYSIGRVEEVFAAEDRDTVYIAEESQLDYLPGDAREALGW